MTNVEETQLSLTNRATNLCKCNGAVDLKTRPLPMCYQSPGQNATGQNATGQNTSGPNATNIGICFYFFSNAVSICLTV